MKAVSISRTGGPDVLEIVEIAPRDPGPGEVRVRHDAIGLNFIDTYQRSGLYPMKLPAVLGLEAAGIIEAVGKGVTRFSVGDRVGYNGQPGAYAEANTVKADRVVRLPEALSSREAAAILLKGMTAEFLVRRVRPPKAGDTVLVHAAAGGVGSILCPWLASLSVSVIGAVGTAEKAAAAKSNGCYEALVYSDGAIAPRVRHLTGGGGVSVVYDSVGRDTLDGSLDSLARRGMLISFGNASGPPRAVEPLELSRRGSLFLTRPSLYDYVATTAKLDASAEALFDVVASGAVKAEVSQTFQLEDARAAHEALEGRRTTGATLLIP